MSKIRIRRRVKLVDEVDPSTIYSIVTITDCFGNPSLAVTLTNEQQVFLSLDYFTYHGKMYAPIPVENYKDIVLLDKVDDEEDKSFVKAKITKKIKICKSTGTKTKPKSSSLTVAYGYTEEM